ncbi:hypothetical protein BGW36DRAFT_264843, partial [Talaromyces proteolyticus]
LPPRPNRAARHTKRLTLSFPIVSPPAFQSEQSSPSVGPVTPVVDTPRTTMASGQPPLDSLAPPSEETRETTDLLTAIASQERKVLELREELQKAETELAGLKKQWVSNERQKKRTEISYHAEAMKPMKPTDAPAEESPRASETSSPSTTDPTSVQVRRSKELERRTSVRSSHKANVSISSNGRRVFAGSKHTRTLSLLSPEMGVVRSPFPMKDGENQKAGGENQVTRHPRSATLPSVERAEVSNSSEQANSLEDDAANQWRRSMPPPSREALLRTGRQMASDLREGLWTFLEDIRQATVGEEGISGTESRTLQPPAAPRRSSSGQRSERSVTPSRNRERPETLGRSDSSQSMSKETAKISGKTTPLAGAEVSFWSEFGVDTPGQKSKTKQRTADNIQNEQKEPENSSLQPEETDDWVNWETPQPAKSHTPSSSQSTINSKKDQSPSTQLSSPRTSASFGERNIDGEDRRRSESIPWPALSKFTASQLTRTASSLMDEWEKSLTSSKQSSPKLDQDEWEAF